MAQVYGTAPASRVKKPLKQLLGFIRLKNMEPGETRRVELTIPTEEFRFYDTTSSSLMVEEGCYTIYAGASSADRQLTATVEVPGEKTGLRNLTVRVAADHYDDYENIVLTEGQFGYCAAALSDPKKDGVLCYRDCLLGENPVAINLHLMSQQGGSAEVLINGNSAASWQGDTSHYLQNPPQPMDEKGHREAIEREKTWKTVYADVKLALPDDIVGKAANGQGTEISPCTLTIRLTGDIRLCYFKILEA